MMATERIRSTGHLLIPLLLTTALLFVGVASRALGPQTYSSIWDDAYIYARYADNLLADRTLAWNPGGPPTYGITGPSYLMVVVPMRLLFPDEPIVALLASSLVCGLLFLGLVVALTGRLYPGQPALRRALVFYALLSLAVANDVLGLHFASGMDTAFVLAFVAFYLWLVCGYQCTPGGKRAMLLGILGGLAWAARPDLVLFTLAVPVALVLRPSVPVMRRHGLLALTLVIGLLAVQLVFSAYYFRSALPLAFYTKGLTGYGAALAEQYSRVPVRQFGQFVLLYWHLFLLAGLGLVASFRARGAHTAIDQGLGLATVLFCLYYLGFVLQIMPYGARFYHPTLPVLLYLACRGAGPYVLRCIDAKDSGATARAWSAGAFVAVILLAAMLGPAALGLLSKWRAFHPNRLDVSAVWREGYPAVWYRLDEFSALPDDAVFASTEVGLLSAMNPDRVIVDLSGLNETEFARQGFSARRLLEGYRPDLIYLPHPDYKEMIREILEAPTFRRMYDYWSQERLGGAVMGLGLRRDSPYYARMRRIAERGLHGGDQTISRSERRGR